MRALIVARFDDSLKGELNRVVRPEFAPWTLGDQWSSSDLAGRLKGIDLLTTEEQDPVGFIDKQVYDRTPELKMIMVAGRRPRADVAAATEAGILVCVMPGLNAEAVADLTLAFFILCARHVLPAVTQLKEGLWQQSSRQSPMDWVYQNFTGFELAGRTAGLIGLGAIGVQVARRLKAFGMRILGCDPHVSQEQAVDLGVTLVSLDDLLARSDFVSLHAALTDQTRKLLGAHELSLMKSSAFLINTARADLVEERALYQVLGEGRIAGAALDVFHVEPLPSDSPLLSHPSVILTPHISGASSDQLYYQSRAFLDAVRSLRIGEAPANLVNPEVLATPQARYQLTEP